MKSLTIEQLKSLKVSDWVWLIYKDTDYRRYAQIQAIEGTRLYVWGRGLAECEMWKYSDYGIKWLAYKNKEQAEGEANKEKPTKELSECYAYAQSACCTDDEQVYWLAGCIMTLTQVIADMMGIELYDLNGSANEARLQEQRGEK